MLITRDRTVRELPPLSGSTVTTAARIDLLCSGISWKVGVEEPEPPCRYVRRAAAKSPAATVWARTVVCEPTLTQLVDALPGKLCNTGL